MKPTQRSTTFFVLATICWLLLPLGIWSQGISAESDSFHLLSARIKTSFYVAENLQYYHLINRLDANSEVISSELCYRSSLAEIRSENEIWLITIDHNGTESYRSLDISEASAYYKGEFIPPTIVPDSILGTLAYYRWRENDFIVRNYISGVLGEVPDYYSDYGDKYANRFQKVIRMHLSVQGQKWVDQTLFLLQVATESELIAHPTIEWSGTTFRYALFDMHPEVYEVAGFFDLKFIDQMKVLIRLDVKDLISHEGRKQAKTLAKKYVQHALIVKMHRL